MSCYYITKNDTTKMVKKDENATGNVAKINEMSRNTGEMSVLDKIAYLHELGKEADKKHELLKEAALTKLNRINSALSEYEFDAIQNACDKAFDFDADYIIVGPLDEIIFGLKVKQVHTINKVLIPVLDADMMFESLNGTTSLDEMIKVCETFLKIK